MAKQKMDMTDEQKAALVVLLLAGYNVTLYKKIDALHSIERIYSLPTITDGVDKRMIKAVEYAMNETEPDGG